MLQPGYVINDTYRVERLLGSGGMADVYVVVHMRLPRKFALKVMHLEQGTRQVFLERFNREGEILASLRHPHIVDVVDRNQLPDGNPYLVMELLEGEDLAMYLARTGTLPVAVALRICCQIGDALEAAHKVGIVHRDLKPSNIFLLQKGPVLNFVKVLDFGIAKVTATERTPMTAPAALMGTPAYMSPEQALGRVREIDPRTDQFALGAVLYEMLTGRGAFSQPGDVVYAILERVVHQHPEPLKEPQLNHAIMRALSKRPEHRFPNILEFLAAVGATTHTVYSLPSLPAPAPSTPSGHNGEGKPLPAKGRGRVRAAVGLGIGLVVATLSVWFAVMRQPLKPAASPPAVYEPAQAPVSGTALFRATIAPPASPPAVSSLVQPPVSSSPPASVGQEESPPQETFIPVPGSAVPKPETGAVVKAATPSRPTTAPSRRFVFSGSKNVYVEKGVLACAREHLAPLRLPDGSAVELQRSGTLAVVDAPASVYATGFQACLREVLSHIDYQLIPQSATVRLTR
jgi:serine/threonine-protein kinase